MKIVTVIPLAKSPFIEDLTYFTVKEVPNGSIVTIPLRNKKILGLVIASEDVSEAKSNIKGMDFNLRKIIDVKNNSVFRVEYIEAILLAAKYFALSKNNVAAYLLPASFRENYDIIEKIIKPEARSILGSLSSDKNSQKIKTEKLLFQAPLEDRISYYKTMIRESFARKISIFIVLPTEKDIIDWSLALGKGIEQFTFTIHGRLTSKKILERTGEIISKDHPILILGTAPFLSIPRMDIETIILEHESSASYKTVQKPHFDLRTFAEIFASKINARFILSDTLLRLETVAREQTDGLGTIHPLSFRINFEGELHIENPRKELLDRKFRIFSEKTIEAIQTMLNKKKNVFIFSLRKGLASITVCKDCGDNVNCEKCGAPLVLYLSQENKKRMYVCNKCSEEKSADTACKRCGSWNLMPLGIGTDTVTEEIKKLFPKEKVLQLDKETAETNTGANKISREFSQKDGAILIGTEMALFYLKDPVPLSIVASFDSLWSIPNYKMSEKVLGLMISILKFTDKKMIIQTKNENDPAILAVQSGNLLSFIRDELSVREKLGYPPFMRFVKITHVGDKTEMFEAKAMLGKIFAEYKPEIFSGFVARFKGKFATNALIKVDPKHWSLPEIATDGSINEKLLQQLDSLPPAFQIFVDPEDLL